MLANGNKLTLVRICASTLISIVAVGSGAYLLGLGIHIPIEFWGIAFLAVGGVAGADVIAQVTKKE